MEQAHELTHEVFFFIVPILLMFFLKSFVEEIVGGLLWKWRSGYDEDDLVKLNGDWARIVHIGLFRSKFYVYVINARDEIVGGYKMSVLNNELRKMTLKEPLNLIDIPKNLRKVTN